MVLYKEIFSIVFLKFICVIEIRGMTTKVFFGIQYQCPIIKHV